jgi:hypothetical protein
VLVVGTGAAVVVVGGTVVVGAAVVVGAELVLVADGFIDCLVLFAVVAIAALGGDEDLPAKKAPTATPARTTTSSAT